MNIFTIVVFTGLVAITIEKYLLIKIDGTEEMSKFRLFLYGNIDIHYGGKFLRF